MPTPTLEPIATTTLASAAASITFSSIPATFTDLRVTFLGTASSPSNFAMRFNSDTATNYSITAVYGYGTSAGSSRRTNGSAMIFTNAVNLETAPVQLFVLDIFSYAAAIYKSVLGQGSQDMNGSGATERDAGLWRSTAAINTVTLLPLGNNFNAGTTATLYGIKAA